MKTTKPNKRAQGRQPSPVAAAGQREDEAFLASYDASQFERPSVTVDVALLTVADDALHTLVAPRTAPPQRGRHALPGGFVRPTESRDEAASRVLREKAGITRVYLEQLYTFGAVHRDPRTRVITVAYYALVDRERLAEASGASGHAGHSGHPGHVLAGNRIVRISVPWEGETGGPVAVHAGDAGDAGDELPLAFDHAEILGMAVRRVRGKLDYTPIGFQLLPERFTLLSLQRVHETVLSRPLNKDSFRRRMLASGQLEATGEEQAGVDHRPAALYRFARRSAV